MTNNKRKKVVKQRGSKTHGWGSMKKHRGAGNRGGRGMAGTGKRGDCKKPSILKDKKYFGKHGFKSKRRSFTVGINVSELSRFGKDTLNLTELGFGKLLGGGKAINKYNLTVDYATAIAIKKIEEAGGKVNISGEASKLSKTEESKVVEPEEKKEEN